MEQLLLNLLENAAKYTPEGSPVAITARSVADGLEIAVADRGPGLAPDELEKVFDLFYQGRKAAGGAGGRKGYGIGLAICRAIALVHGGTIRAENREGGGAAFIVTLPAPRRRRPPHDGPGKDEETL
jgi:two-component system sensor histidine kinase KdpD